MKKLLCVCLFVLASVVTASAQPVSNPTLVSFDPSTDHALVSVYEFGYFSVGGTSPISSYSRTPAQLTPSGASYQFGFPRLLFGTFEHKLRACAPAQGGGTVCSAWVAADKQSTVSPLAPGATRIVQ